ncbi:DUF1835 domain-containing protein [Robertkochia sediminum]|uniref:DUF1835 domain-containing protein n=1 Tax=Robertkochia sediminum TaxID=2785326 RepID=UPI001931F84D|nr:DUF1835 domain-containing protein [Robertkochia sediminum]MBL7473520.1 DUF1835 domain-containing protein [Robertkochia sediminum]
MKTPLHITNGDALTQTLEQLDLEGYIVTWREMLCEGKTTTDVGSESFWRQRFEFLNSRYKVSKKKFIDLTLKEYRNLCKHKKEDEIVLWFEDDLFCQVNMLAVLSWLLKHRKHANIFLVKLTKKDKKGRWVPLSDLNEKELRKCYEKRQLLSEDDIEYADYIWQLYCESNPMRLQNAINEHREAFPFLSPALEAHYRRFPSVKNGLNFLENRMLEITDTHTPANKSKLIGAMLGNQENYGFTELQYESMSKRLRPMFQAINPVRLSKLGKEVLAGTTNYYPVLRNDNDYLGGASKYAYLFYEEENQLLKL